MTTKTKVIIVVVSLATAFAFGRYTVPVKVVTQVKTVEVEKQSTKTAEKQDKKEHKVTTITQTKKPNGEETTTTQITYDANSGKDINSSTNTNIAENKDSKTETVKESSHMNVSFLAGTNILGGISSNSGNPMLYGGIVTRGLIGPISISGWGLSNGTCGLGIGLSF